MRQHMSRPSHAPHPSPQRSVAGNVECVAHEMQAARKPTRAGVGRSPSRPKGTRTASGFRQRRAAVAEQCLAVDACVHALVCLCACAFAFVLRARMCLRGSVWMRLCARARARVCACRRVPVRACVPPDASRARQPACAAHDRRCAASMAVGSNGRISARDMPRRAPVDGPSDAPVHASRRA
jgi:hypothetical protein